MCVSFLGVFEYPALQFAHVRTCSALDLHYPKNEGGEKRERKKGENRIEGVEVTKLSTNTFFLAFFNTREREGREEQDRREEGQEKTRKERASWDGTGTATALWCRISGKTTGLCRAGRRGWRRPLIAVLRGPSPHFPRNCRSSCQLRRASYTVVNLN